MTPRRRKAARCFVIVMLAIFICDTWPRTWSWSAAVNQYLGPAIHHLGLWQYDWNLFAPNPHINNGWYSAEIVDDTGVLKTWSSPYWGKEDGWKKFIEFREMNYFNRVAHDNRRAVDDLAVYIRRQMVAELETAKLSPGLKFKFYRNEMQLVMPDDGSLPVPEEATWLSTTVLLREWDAVP